MAQFYDYMEEYLHMPALREVWKLTFYYFDEGTISKKTN